MTLSTTHTRTRFGALALAAAGVLFLLYPALRPWHDESTVAGATAAMGAGAWTASHLFAVAGFILVPLGLLALRGAVSHTRAEPVALAAVITTWVGAGLTLPYYGAETFGLAALAGEAGEVGEAHLLDLVEAVRFQPLAVTTFGLGLLGLAAGAVLAAAAIWRSGNLARYSGVPFALGFVLFLPQFYLPAPARIGHGLLVAVGLLWIALALWRSTPDQRDRPGRREVDAAR